MHCLGKLFAPIPEVYCQSEGVECSVTGRVCIKLPDNEINALFCDCTHTYDRIRQCVVLEPTAEDFSEEVSPVLQNQSVFLL